MPRSQLLNVALRHNISLFAASIYHGICYNEVILALLVDFLVTAI